MNVYSKISEETKQVNVVLSGFAMCIVTKFIGIRLKNVHDHMNQDIM